MSVKRLAQISTEERRQKLVADTASLSAKDAPEAGAPASARDRSARGVPSTSSDSVHVRGHGLCETGPQAKRLAGRRVGFRRSVDIRYLEDHALGYRYDTERMRSSGALIGCAGTALGFRG
jgi:hypothetical protein